LAFRITDNIFNSPDQREDVEVWFRGLSFMVLRLETPSQVGILAHRQFPRMVSNSCIWQGMRRPSFVLGQKTAARTYKPVTANWFALLSEWSWF
jgi:hypothetical protein